MEDCICAIATAVGGAVAILRLSGEGSEHVASQCWKALDGRSVAELPPRQLVLGQAFREHDVLDAGCLAVRMPAPRSYTGEDIVELHCHGGALVARAILQALLHHGARLANPGEFTRRAFLNGKLDLTQAEAIADMIAAGSEAALRLANQQLNGVLGQRIRNAQEQLQDLLAEIESRLDFPDEELDFRSPGTLVQQAESIAADLARLAATRQQGELLRAGVPLAIAGPPNVGKSSLLNLLLGRERAIVSDLPGTTRDTVEENVQLRGIPFRLMDTAGVRDDSADTVEAAGIERARRAAENASLVLWIFDATRPYAEQEWPGWSRRGPVLLVANKSDLLTNRPVLPPGTVLVSALTGNGMDTLLQAMEEAVLPQAPQESDFAVAARHADLLERSAGSLREAASWLNSEAWELAAVPVRAAIAELGQITGTHAPPDVLDTIFSRFCIGK